MGSNYLRICCCLSLESTGFAICERFLQATGKTMYSTIAQIFGAVINIVFDYIFILPCVLGAAGAAWATVFGQIVSLSIAMAFHYLKNKEIDGSLKYIKPEMGIIKGFKTDPNLKLSKVIEVSASDLYRANYSLYSDIQKNLFDKYFT